MSALSTDVPNFRSISKSSLFFTRQPWFVPIILAAITLVMHHSALNGFWRFDDGWLLGFITCYAPEEYFLIPSITREISYAFVTPWLPLTYDINLTLFGLNPLGYYAHQLVSLSLAAYMSFTLLRLWVNLGWAVFGATLFLIGLPTVYIAQELMTGHYLEGLIFACIAIYGFVRTMRGNSRYWLLLGILGYALACTCKEIYVPIPILLLALPEDDWKKRLRFAAPFLMVTLLYLCWRIIVLGTAVGGYAHEQSKHVFSLSKILLAYIKLPTLLFRHNLLGYLALAALAILLFFNTTRRGWWLVLGAAGALLFPLAPLAILGLLETPSHYLFLIWWAVAMGVAVLAGGDWRYLARHLRLALVAFIGVAAFQASRAETKALIINIKPLEALYRFALTNKPTDNVLPSSVSWDSSWQYARFIYEGFLSAASSCSIPPPHPKLLSSVEAIAATRPEKVHLYRYDTGCSCIKEVTSTIPELLSTFLPKSENRSLKIIFLPPPYQRRRDQPRITDTNPYGGLIESINISGETLEITGWARIRDDEPEQNIALFIPALPVKQSLVSIERPDVAKHLNNPHYLGAGFRATLQFSSSTNAKYAADHICAQKLAGGSFAPIENPTNQECSVLFWQRD